MDQDSHIESYIPDWMTLAFGEMGQREILGALDNPRILEYRRYTYNRSPHDEVAWCSDFINFVLGECGYRITRSARARSWADSDVVIEIPTPRYGALVVYWRDNPTCGKGHVHFWIGESNDTIWGIGGNQNDSVCIKGYPKNRRIGYYWPERDSVE